MKKIYTEEKEEACSTTVQFIRWSLAVTGPPVLDAAGDLLLTGGQLPAVIKNIM